MATDRWDVEVPAVKHDPVTVARDARKNSRALPARPDSQGCPPRENPAKRSADDRPGCESRQSCCPRAGPLRIAGRLSAGADIGSSLAAGALPVPGWVSCIATVSQFLVAWAEWVPVMGRRTSSKPSRPRHGKRRSRTPAREAANSPTEMALPDPTRLHPKRSCCAADRAVVSSRDLRRCSGDGFRQLVACPDDRGGRGVSCVSADFSIGVPDGHLLALGGAGERSYWAGNRRRNRMTTGHPTGWPERTRVCTRASRRAGIAH